MPQQGRPKRRADAAPGPQQQQISELLGDRVTKPRSYAGNVPPLLKKQKLDSAVPGAVIPAAPKPPLPAVGVTVQKRKWRLSEILKKDREAKVKRANGQPAFVFHAPHMDSRRPGSEGTQDTGKVGNDSEGLRKTAKAQSTIGWNPQVKVKVSESTVADGAGVQLRTHDALRDTPGIRSHGIANVSGGEAILYSRSMLPKGHLLLLDILVGLESALALLKTRKVFPTFGAVRGIVRRSTRREFTYKSLSQLAHIVPEAVAVLPGLKDSTAAKRPIDEFILRLDDVDDREGTRASLASPGSFGTGSKLGDSAARMRRSLLHERLLEHVRDYHASFLKRRCLTRHTGNMWHPEFSLEVDVAELPAPPLYVEHVPKRPKSIVPSPAPPGTSASLRTKAADNTHIAIEQSGSAALGQCAGERDGEAENVDRRTDDGHCIPTSLLEKVRARTRAREVDIANVESEKMTNRSLLSKLPCTMDTICSVLRGEKRTAMGWSQLMMKVERLHPKKWPKEDLARQFDAITTLAAVWCRKVELTGPRGGFAFRVVSEANFGRARATVCSTTAFTPME